MLRFCPPGLIKTNVASVGEPAWSRCSSLGKSLWPSFIFSATVGSLFSPRANTLILSSSPDDVGSDLFDELGTDGRGKKTIAAQMAVVNPISASGQRDRAG